MLRQIASLTGSQRVTVNAVNNELHERFARLCYWVEEHDDHAFDSANVLMSSLVRACLTFGPREEISWTRKTVVFDA